MLVFPQIPVQDGYLQEWSYQPCILQLHNQLMEINSYEVMFVIDINKAFNQFCRYFRDTLSVKACHFSQTQALVD